MPLDPIASQEGSFSDAQPARMAAGLAETEGEACGFPRSPYAARLRVGDDRPRLPGSRANCSPRAFSLKLKTALARGRGVPS
jgi:hypothetical protein